MARRMATLICLFVIGLSFAAAGDVTLDDEFQLCLTNCRSNCFFFLKKNISKKLTRQRPCELSNAEAGVKVGKQNLENKEETVGERGIFGTLGFQFSI